MSQDFSSSVVGFPVKYRRILQERNTIPKKRGESPESRRSTQPSTIVLAWVNDERNLRAYINKTDAYATFRKMLDGGNPTDCFDALMNEAATAAARLEGSLAAAAIRSS